MGFFKKKSIEELKAEREREGKKVADILKKEKAKREAENERENVKKDITRIKAAKSRSSKFGKFVSGAGKVVKHTARGSTILYKAATSEKVKKVYKGVQKRNPYLNKPKKRKKGRRTREPAFNLPGF